MLELVGTAFGAEPDQLDSGTRWYRRSAEIGTSAFIAWEPRTRVGVTETYVEIRQTGFDVLGGEAGMELARQVLALRPHITRADGYYDDVLRRAEPETVAEAFEQGFAVTHVSRMRQWKQSQRNGSGGVETAGASTYLGSSKSLKQLRVYDKEAESGVSGAGVRWAGAFLDAAVAPGVRLGSHVLGTIRGLVDFRQRGAGSRGDRAGLLDWWERIIGDAQRASLRQPTKENGPERTALWLHKQVAPSLAFAHQVFGDEFVRDLLASGGRRLTKDQLRLVAAGVER